jgi:tartrate dehydratase beta subunit/fumarate hydratase class I family protein
MGRAVARLDDVAMDEVHLTTPVSDEAIRSLKLGDVVYLSGALYTAREGVYRQVVDKGIAFPDAVRALTNVNFHCSPAAATRPDGTHVVEAVTATASFRFGKSMGPWFERSGARVIVGKAGLTELAYREWFVPHGAVYLTASAPSWSRATPRAAASSPSPTARSTSASPRSTRTSPRRPSPASARSSLAPTRSSDGGHLTGVRS